MASCGSDPIPFSIPPYTASSFNLAVVQQVDITSPVSNTWYCSQGPMIPNGSWIEPLCMDPEWTCEGQGGRQGTVYLDAAYYPYGHHDYGLYFHPVCH